MTNIELFWRTDGEGRLEAAVDGFTVVVERMLPAADACYIVYRGGEAKRALASGNCRSVADAMLAAAETARRISGSAASFSHSH